MHQGRPQALTENGASPAVLSLSPTGERDPLVVSTLAGGAALPGLGVDVAATLAWCVEVGRRAPLAGSGDARRLWEILASTASRSVSAARMLEPHLDALSILRQAGIDLAQHGDAADLDCVSVDADSSWGVFAAESADVRLDAVAAAGGWVLRGTKPWCSLAANLSHALVTAFVGESDRRLFAVDLRAAGVRPRHGEWSPRGLPHVVSSPVDFDEVPAVPVGETGWYLARPGFAWGGMSVAACWWGAAQGISDALLAPARSERADQLALVHLGRVDAALWAARATLAEAAELVDAGGSGEDRDRILAERVRAVVVDAAVLTLAETDAALGPAPLVTNAGHAARVSDLHLYLRQHHGSRDLARIGRLRSAATA